MNQSQCNAHTQTHIMKGTHNNRQDIIFIIFKGWHLSLHLVNLHCEVEEWSCSLCLSERVCNRSWVEDYELSMSACWVHWRQLVFIFLSHAAAGLMHTFNAHAATDITGFGILGHAQTLARQQRSEVSFVIHNLPVLAKMAAVSKACGNMFGLMHGTCPETSGKPMWQKRNTNTFIYV